MPILKKSIYLADIPFFPLILIMQILFFNLTISYQRSYYMDNYIKANYKFPTANKNPKHRLTKKGQLSAFLKKFQGKIYQIGKQGTLQILSHSDKQNITENSYKGKTKNNSKGEALKTKSKSLNIARLKIKTQNDSGSIIVQESHQLKKSYLSNKIFKSSHKNITFQQSSGKKYDSDPIRNFYGNPRGNKKAEITPFFLPNIYTKQDIEQQNKKTGEFGGAIRNEKENKKTKKQRFHPKNRKYLQKAEKKQEYAEKNKMQKML